MSDWRPIETAPKDGTKIDVWTAGAPSTDGERITDVWWGVVPFEEKSGPGWIRFHDEFMETRVERISHWMPIPEPPK